MKPKYPFQCFLYLLIKKMNAESKIFFLTCCMLFCFADNALSQVVNIENERLRADSNGFYGSLPLVGICNPVLLSNWIFNPVGGDL
ncbi:MAG: hypothetical protein ABIO98_10100 [Chitinophagales bacterium]